MKMKTITRLAAACATLALLGGAAMADVTLKLGHLANEDNIWHKAALKFGEEVQALSDGRVKVQVYPNESLGKEMDLINGMQLGTADMTITGESLQNWAPKAALLALPYGYRSLEHMDKVASGEIGKQIEAEIIEKASVRPLTYFARGPRNLSANKEIKTPDELKGFKLRVPNVPIFVAAWQAMGANPTPMAFSEVFTSLQNGTINGQENPLALFKSGGFYEVQKVINKTEHVRSWIYLVISERTWNKLSDQDKAAVTEAAKRTQVHERALFLADEAALVKDLEGRGVKFVDVDKEAFAAKARDAVIKAVPASIRPLAEQIFNSN
ncbi:TRAP transporter substrate-binding protein [Ancylobacter defluvii]|uniref:C4-dicarboxylate ABC transporter substrate-binding protein n=1 Tax=Ancylobacter defluvii TaxID=1282440 RepID=A0A9W6N9S0_9HYPH|nr:TRAP transporter substrate-binding protein [Ancylobacter defluvii]MBS7590243.1 TRAP transporter substrate-binding protein [Ancylobacter defluvii]GLK82888.1 C4-dicarboxylate ABC transporter substrate-binding protein [Ancylobacter defluvii]